MDTDSRNEQIGKQLGAITADLKTYIEKRVELILLNIGEQISAWMAASLYRVTGALVLLIGILFLLVALAIFLGDVMDSEPLGYIAVAVPLMIIGLLFLYLKPKHMIRKMEEQFESEVIKAVSRVETDRQHKLRQNSEKKKTDTEKPLPDE